MPFLIHIVFLFQAMLVLESSRKTEASDFMIDELGNLYLIHQNWIERENAVGNGTFRTSDLRYGNIGTLDVTNPLKPFLFYKDIGKVILLDNTLSQQGNEIDLFDLGFTQAELVAGSRGDAYWVWDSRNSELLRLNQSFQVMQSTGNIGVLLGLTLEPLQILERGDYLYLRDKNLGVLIFDIYGTYRTRLNIQTSQDIQVFNGELIYADGTQIHVLGKDWLSGEDFDLPSTDPRRIIYFNQRLYCLSGNELEVWKRAENTRN